METNKAILYSAKIENDALVSIKGEHYLITDKRITGLSWTKNEVNENHILFISGEGDKLKLEISEYNDLFVKMDIEIIVSEEKCTMVDPKILFNPERPEYEDQDEYKKLILDKRTNETCIFMKDMVEQIYVLSKTYIYLRNIETYGYDTANIMSQIKKDVSIELDNICQAYELEKLSDLVSFLCMFLSKSELYEFMQILGGNFIDFSFRLSDDFMNLCWSGGIEIRNKIIEECLSKHIDYKLGDIEGIKINIKGS